MPEKEWCDIRMTTTGRSGWVTGPDPNDNPAARKAQEKVYHLDTHYDPSSRCRRLPLGALANFVRQLFGTFVTFSSERRAREVEGVR